MKDPERRPDDIDAEIADHIERRVRDLCAGGMRETDARLKATAEFGDLSAAKRDLQTIDARIERRRRVRIWSGIGGDARTAARRLAGQPGATALTIFTLALAIGVAAAVFSIVDQLILRPPPFLHADRLVDVWHLNGPNGSGGSALSPAKVLGWQEQRAIFERFETYSGYSLDLAAPTGPARVNARVVSLGLFDMLGIAPHIGRLFEPGDGAPGSEKVVILGHAFWRSRMSGTPSVLGSQVLLNDDAYTVVGVLPRRTMLFDEEDDEAVWLPFDLRAAETAPRIYGFHGVARLAPGLHPAQASVIADRLAAELSEAQPIPRSWYLKIEGKKVASVPPETARTLFVLLGAVGILLLIACVNVTSFSLVQALRRTRELRLRAALGASRWRIMREVLVETLLVAMTAGIAASLLAYVSLAVVTAAVPDGFAYRVTRPVELDLRVFAIMAAATLIVGLFAGILPGARASRADIAATLKDGARGSRQGRASGGLVVIEVALAMVLLVGAALMSRTLAAYHAIEPGFDVDRLVTAKLQFPSNRYPTEQARRAFFAELDGRLRRQPGLEASAYAWGLPPHGGLGLAQPQVEGADASGEEIEYFANAVSPAYFAVTGTRLLTGRSFTWEDGDDLVVVGVARNVESRFGGARSDLQMYIPMAVPRQAPAPPVPGAPRSYATRMLIVRASQPALVSEALRAAVHAIDPLQAFDELAFGIEIYAQPFAQQRLLLKVMGGLAAIALLLAAMGIFGVLSQAVTRRRREIGIRVALGAGHARLIRMLVGRGLALAVIGAVIGTVASLAGARTLESLLFGVSPFDPVSFVAVIAVLMAVALIACWWPTKRALAVEPAEVLRSE